jgi:hypothetical protein
MISFPDHILIEKECVRNTIKLKYCMFLYVYVHFYWSHLLVLSRFYEVKVYFKNKSIGDLCKGINEFK